MVGESAPICPRCRQLDATRSVVAIVTEGISLGSYQTVVPLQIGSRTIYLPSEKDIASSNLLVRRLLPPKQPPRPREPKRSDFKIKNYKEPIPREYQLSNVIVTTWHFVIIVILIYLVEAVLGLNQAGIGVVFGVGLVLFPFVGILYLLLIHRAVHPIYKHIPWTRAFYEWDTENIAKAKEHMEADYQRARKQYQYELWKHQEGWHKALDKWRHLVYCSRCDGVFIPGQNRFIPVEQMHSFLLEQAIYA